MRMQISGFTWTSLFMIAVLITGCDNSATPDAADGSGRAGDGTAAAGAQGTIGISVQTLTNPFFKVIAETVTREANERGYQVLVRDAEGKIENQNNQVKEFVVKQVNAIFLCPRDTKAIGPVIKEANAAGVPVFTIDTLCETTDAKVVQHVGTDNFQGGEVAGQAMIDALGQRGGKVAVLEFNKVESCIDRVRGFTSRINEHNETADNKIEIVTTLDCAGDKELGQSAARDAMNAHPDIAGIFSINDPAALGARAALEAEGRQDEVVVIGFDGQPEAKQAIKEGRLFDSPVQFPDQMAVKCVEAFIRYSEGDAVEPIVLIPTQAYRKAQADQDPNL